MGSGKGGKMKGQKRGKVKGEGDGVKVVIKTETNVFRQFHSPTFFMTQRTVVIPIVIPYYSK